MLEKSVLASSNFNCEVKNTKASLTVSNSVNDIVALEPALLCEACGCTIRYAYVTIIIQVHHT